MKVEIRSRQIEYIQEIITKMNRRYEQDFGNINASNKVRREVIKDLSKIKSLMNDIIIKERIWRNNVELKSKFIRELLNVMDL